MSEFVSAVPIVPARDLEASTGWYRDELGFEVVHVEAEYGVVTRGASAIHFWGRELSVLDRDVNLVTFFEAANGGTEGER